jgi:dTDP-4-dehydrorhamnose reductase
LAKVFATAQAEGTMLYEMAQMLAAGREIRAAYDHVFCPIRIDDLIRNVSGLQAQGVTGLVHVCGPEAWSRYDLALALAEALGKDSQRIRRMSIDDICPIPRRPHDISMQIGRLRKELEPAFTPIRESLRAIVRNFM